MRIVNENLETLNESSIDLTKGYLQTTAIVKSDASPIDNITKFAWDGDDYEVVQLYTLYDNEDSGDAKTPQDDTDSMLVDMEYRLTLLELGLN